MLHSISFSESKRGGLKRLTVESAVDLDEFDLSDPMTLACLAIKGIQNQQIF